GREERRTRVRGYQHAKCHLTPQRSSKRFPPPRRSEGYAVQRSVAARSVEGPLHGQADSDKGNRSVDTRSGRAAGGRHHHFWRWRVQGLTNRAGEFTGCAGQVYGTRRSGWEEATHGGM